MLTLNAGWAVAVDSSGCEPRLTRPVAVHERCDAALGAAYVQCLCLTLRLKSCSHRAAMKILLPYSNAVRAALLIAAALTVSACGDDGSTGATGAAGSNGTTGT